MSITALQTVRREVEATLRSYEDSVVEVSFFLTDQDLLRIQAVGGGDAFLCMTHAQRVFETLLILGLEQKEAELAGQPDLF